MYYICELQNENSYRIPSSTHDGTLSDAKRKATREQVWQDTVLRIDYPDGTPASIKRGGKWQDTDI